MIVRARVLRSLIGVLALFAVACGYAPAIVPAAAPALLQRQDSLAGKLVYVREGNLWVWQAGEARQLTTGGTWRQPAISPDGSEIAYAYREQNFSDLFVMSVDGSSTRRLTRGQATAIRENDWAFRPAWSPDGTRIAYISDASSYFPVVWVMNKDGGLKRQVVGTVANIDAVDAIAWSPDGKRLAFTGMGREPSQIWILDVARGYVEKLTSQLQGAFDPAWSPGGDTIAYIAREGTRGELRIKHVEGSQEIRLDKLAYVRSPAWSPDGQHLAILSAQSGSFEVWAATVEVEGDTFRIGEFRQITRDGGIDAASGVSWGR